MYNSQFEVREVSIEDLDAVVGGKDGDGNGTGTGKGGNGQAKFVHDYIVPIVQAVGGALGLL
jgi:hypothetical protein